jgi:hypothetical protein
VALDGNALFALQVHVVEHLCLHVAFANGMGMLQQPVGQGAFSVIDMGYDAEVPDLLHEGYSFWVRN